MKKLIPILALAMLTAMLAFSVQAEDVKVADVYSTSILATVDGHVIPSYNIGGYTCVCMEDLAYYGFDVTWDPVNGVISATATDKVANYDVYADVQRGEGGSVIGAVYETKICAVVNGLQVESYNIGGYTCVCIETLGDLTDSAYLDFGYSDYYMNAVWDAENAIIALNTFRVTPESENPFILAGLDYGCVYTSGAEYGTVQAGSRSYRDFRGAISKMIPLYYEMKSGMTDIIVGYACPLGVMFDADAIAAILDGEMYAENDPASKAELAMEEDCFETLEYIDCIDCVVLYGRYVYSVEDIEYSLRVFLAGGRVLECLTDLAAIEVDTTLLPVETLRVSEGRTLLSFSIVYNGHEYEYEVDLLTGELDMAM